MNEDSELIATLIFTLWFNIKTVTYTGSMSIWVTDTIFARLLLEKSSRKGAKIRQGRKVKKRGCCLKSKRVGKHL